MGQRSQVYVRITNKEGKKSLIAKYYQWNYGERMISRARYGIDYIKKQFDFIGLDNVVNTIGRIFDINFDMQDILDTTDILQEWLIYGKNWNNTFKEFTFLYQDNNDGKLFIDIDEKSKKIKYCLTDYDLKIFKSPKEYMDWDFEDWLNSEYLDEKSVKKCIRNIRSIEKNATLMTEEELNNFIDDDYTSYLEKKQNTLNNRIKYLKGGE